MSTATGIKRGPYAATRERRERIGDAVVAIVDAEGFPAVTIAAVADRCGLSERTILYHFPTKDHLLVAALELMDDRADAAIDATTDVRTREFDADALRATAAAIGDNQQRLHLYLAMKGFSALPDHPASGYFERRTARVISIYTDLIEHGRTSGHVHPGLDAGSVAVQFAALWDGLIGLSLHDHGIDIAELLVDGFRRLTGANWMDALSSLQRPDVGL